jgi:hypothetical protein
MFIEAGALVYNPYLTLDSQIAATSKDLTGVFDEIDFALDKGRKIRTAVDGERIQKIMRRHLSGARLTGFQDAAKHARVRMPVLYGHKLSDQAQRRAAFINSKMNRTTRRTLKSVPESDFVLSKDRALSAARYENARQYFLGVRDAYKGQDFRKKWITSGADGVCDECALAEDEGKINIDAEFDNGFVFPPGHNNCSCWIAVTR